MILTRFDQLPLTARYDVYLHERALTPGTPDWEPETRTWKQRNPGSLSRSLASLPFAALFNTFAPHGDHPKQAMGCGSGISIHHKGAKGIRCGTFFHPKRAVSI